MNSTANLPAGKSILFYVVQQPKIKTEKPPLLILLHGIGSNEQKNRSANKYIQQLNINCFAYPYAKDLRVFSD
jgi:poly(3-hydroxybutyrate) depolymerase